MELHKQPEYLGFLRMVVADARQFPWIAEEFAAVMDPQTERLARYLDHLTAMGILDCRNPMLAAHQFMGLLNEFSLWPWMMGRESVPVPDEDVVEETVRMFLRSYRRPRPRKGKRTNHAEMFFRTLRGRLVNKEKEACHECSCPTAILDRHLPFECVALVLQGGGALGAYQAGVYEALAEAASIRTG